MGMCVVRVCYLGRVSRSVINYAIFSIDGSFTYIYIIKRFREVHATLGFLPAAASEKSLRGRWRRNWRGTKKKKNSEHVFCTIIIVQCRTFFHFFLFFFVGTSVGNFIRKLPDGIYYHHCHAGSVCGEGGGNRFSSRRVFAPK